MEELGFDVLTQSAGKKDQMNSLLASEIDNIGGYIISKNNSGRIILDSYPASSFFQ